jgi:hypothetical protein
MLKALAKGSDGRPIMILGLSRRNTELLLEGKPIMVDTSNFGIPGGPCIVLLGGETEQAIQAEMAKHMKLPEPTLDPIPEQQSGNPAWDTCPLCRTGDCLDPTHQ